MSWLMLGEPKLRLNIQLSNRLLRVQAALGTVTSTYWRSQTLYSTSSYHSGFYLILCPYLFIFKVFMIFFQICA